MAELGADALLGAAASGVLSQYQGRKDVLAYASASDLSNYDRHFGKLEGASRGEVSLQAAEQYFTSSLIKGDVLGRILDHVGAGQGSGVLCLTRSQFHIVCHLIYATLRVAQDQMWQSDALWAASSKLVTPGAAAKRRPAASEASKPARSGGDGGGGDEWSIRASLPKGPAASAGGQAREEGPPQPALNFLAGPLEDGVYVLSRESSMEDLAGAAVAAAAPTSGASSVAANSAGSAPAAGSVAAYENKLQALQSQLAGKLAELQARGNGDGRLAQLQTLESEVRAALQESSSPGDKEAATATSKSAAWEAFGADFGAGAAALSTPAAQQLAASADVWDSLVQRPAPAAAGPGDEELLQTISAMKPAAPPQPSPFAELNPIQRAAPAAAFDAAWPEAPVEGQLAGLRLGEEPGGEAAAAAPGIDPEAIAALVQSQVLAILRPHLASGEPATARGDYALAASQQLSHAALQAAATARPAPPPMAAAPAWEPMPEGDRQRCETLFVNKGYEVLGGMAKAEAQQLFARSRIAPHLFAPVWDLAHRGADGQLSGPEFCLFMYLLRMVQKGQALPLRLSDAEVAAILGAGPPAAAAAVAAMPAIRVDAARMRSALRPGGSGPLPGAADAEKDPKDDAASSCFDSDDDAASDYGSVATLQSPSKASRRGGGAPQLQTLPRATAAGVYAGSTDPEDGVHSQLEVCVRWAEVKYKKPLDRPFFSVSVRDSLGRLVEMPHDTHPGVFNKDTGAIKLDQAVTLATPLTQLPPGAALFIEIRHWKSSERRFSTVAWASAPLEKMVDFGPKASRVRCGSVDLPLYRKPVDFSAQKARRLNARSAPELHLTVRGLP